MCYFLTYSDVSQIDLRNIPPEQRLSKTCKSKLIAIAKILKEVNSLVRNEVQLNQEYFDKVKTAPTFSYVRQTKFNASDIQNLEYWMSIQFSELNADLANPLDKS